MAIMICEYGGYNKVDVNFQHPLDDKYINENTDSALNGTIVANSLMVDIEGIHAYPYATRNFNRYMVECLRKSIPTWTKPYRRPLIKHHNVKDGEIIGRILNVEYVINKTLSGTPALLFTVNVPGEQEKIDIQNGLLETVSIGIIGHDVKCSICGHQIAENGPCPEHDRGQRYNSEMCYWDIYDIEGKELSYIIVPSDIFAKNIKFYPAVTTNQKTGINESLQKGGKINMTPEELAALQKQLTELQEQLAASSAANKTLNEDKAALEKQVATLTETQTVHEKKVEELNGKLSELMEANKVLAAQVTVVTDSKTVVESELATEKKLREHLENEMVSAKTEMKTNLVETLQAMRKAVGKVELTEDAVKSRSEESLRDTIKDLKEELNSVIPAAGSVKPPALAENDEKNADSNVKDKKLASNIDLQEGLENLFNLVTNAHK